MIKQSIRFISFVLALFISLLVFDNISNGQRMPFGTTKEFILSVGKSTISKENIIADLNEMTDSSRAVLVKVAVDAQDHKNKKDIIWFGSEEPETEGVVVEDQKISWLDTSLTGQMIRPSEIGSRPLHGEYAVKGDQKFQDVLNTWAKSNNLGIEWKKTMPVPKFIFFYLFVTGLGNAVLTAFLLLLTTFIAWFVVHARTRTLKLLGGVSSGRIHMEDVISLGAFIATGFLTGGISVLGYVGARGGFRQIPLIAGPVFLTLFLSGIVLSVILSGISFLVRPRAAHIAGRQIPLGRFSRLGTIVRVASVFLALLIVPTTIMSAIISYKLANEHDLWQSVSKNVRVSLRDIEPLETKEMLPGTEAFFEDMQKNNNLRLSMAIDKAIVFDKEMLGGYDHIIMTDMGWLDTFEVGVSRQRAGGMLSPIDFEKLPSQLKESLDGQIQLWTKTEELQPKGLGFYEYKGEQLLAMPPNPGDGAETIHAKNPLVILVNNAPEVLKAGFLLSALSSGNVVFVNEEQLRQALPQYPIAAYVSSINSIADKALEAAQQFRKEMGYYITACVLILMSMVFAGIMSAQLWAGANKKRIFTLHTYGRSYGSIIEAALNREFMILAVTIFLGSAVVYFVKYPQIAVLALVALAIAVLYGVGNLSAYILCAKRMFRKTSHRYY